MTSDDDTPRTAEAESIDRVTEAFDIGSSDVPGTGQRTTPQPLPNGVVHAGPWRRLAAWALDVVLFALTLGVGWLIWAYTLESPGQTPAKKILNLRVVLDHQTAAAGLSRMFVMRWFLGGLLVPIAISLTLGVLLFMPFWDPRNRNLWDRLSSCVVVYDADRVWDVAVETRAAAHATGAGPWRG
jgi:uncharacterized RDD family membrane protein YckC